MNVRYRLSTGDDSSCPLPPSCYGKIVIDAITMASDVEIGDDIGLCFGFGKVLDHMGPQVGYIPIYGVRILSTYTAIIGHVPNDYDVLVSIVSVKICELWTLMVRDLERTCLEAVWRKAEIGSVVQLSSIKDFRKMRLNRLILREGLDTVPVWCREGNWSWISKESPIKGAIGVSGMGKLFIESLNVTLREKSPSSELELALNVPHHFEVGTRIYRLVTE